MSSHDSPPEEESRDDGHISFVQRLQRQFGHDVEPITLQTQEEGEGEAKDADAREGSSPSLGLVRKLAGQAGLGPRYQAVDGGWRDISSAVST